MGLFDFLKGKNDKPSGSSVDRQLQSDIERFEKEIFGLIPRYISKPGQVLDIKARHQETKEVIPFAIGFPEQFEPWRNVKSQADRRGIIYKLFDSQFGNQLELWQLIERFNDDRYPQHALDLAVKHKTEADMKNPDYWSALARTNFILANYTEAEANSLKALELDPDSIRAKRIYADVLHNNGQHENAHQIYNAILEAKLPKDKEMTLPVQDLLGFDGDVVNSPVYAVSWLRSDKNMNQDTWDWASEEFYYSPYFRTQHAFHLVENKEYLRGFAKLLSLSKEMPWYKDAVVNSYSLIGQLNLDGEQIEGEKIRLKGIMEKNGWS